MTEDQKPAEDMPPAVGQVNGESDTLAERAGVEVRDTRRPIPAEPVDPPFDPERKVAAERREVAGDCGEGVPADAEPTD
jgi:hypothetical protein